MKTPARLSVTALSIAALFACTMKKNDVSPDNKDAAEYEDENRGPAPVAMPAGSSQDVLGNRNVTSEEQKKLDRIYPESSAGKSDAPVQAQAKDKKAYAPMPSAASAPERLAEAEAYRRNAPVTAAMADATSGGLAKGVAQGSGVNSRLYPQSTPIPAPTSAHYAAAPKPAASEPRYRAQREAKAENYRDDNRYRGEYGNEEGTVCNYCQPPQPQPQPNTEEYAAIYENPFLAARANPLSTFSIDVDGASYSNTRRFLQEGNLPPADAVRIEEFINYFDYDYPQPSGSDPFSITTEVAATPWNPDTKLVHIGLQGRRMQAEKLPPNNLVFLIDVSGSMMPPERLPLLKNAFSMLIDQLRPQDRISIVVYAGAAGMVLPPTSGADKETIRAALLNLEAGGSTAGGAGLLLAYQAAKQSFIAGGSNRVILATDGDFNVGVSSDEELVRLIEEKRKSGVFLSVLGFGEGNYKDAKMEQLADKGNGNYFYIDNINEARKVLVEKMTGTLYTIAKDVKLQIEFNPATVKSYRLIGYENRMLAAEDFNDDRKDAGELGAGTNVTALYEVVPMNPPKPKVDPLKYQGGHSRWNWGFGGGEDDGELLTVKFRYKQPSGSTSKLLSRVLKNRDASWQDASENFRFSAAAAGFGLMLRGSQYRGNLDYDKVAAIARGARGRDLEGHRAEFISLVETARNLSGYGNAVSRGYGE